MSSPNHPLSRRGLLGLALAAAAPPPPPRPGGLRRGRDLHDTALDLQARARKKRMHLFIGTYTGAKSRGIYRAVFDPARGQISSPEVAAETPNPTFVALHPSGRRLYAVSEIGDFQGARSGALAAFDLNPRSGELSLLNRQPTRGAGPCHLVTDRAGNFVLAANYGGGSVVVLRIREDGSLGEETAFVQHQGKSVNPRRQEGPHAHSINLDAENRFAFAADLGLDRILIYRFDRRTGALSVNDPAFAEVAPGSGPRHLAFHPNGRFAYVINELLNTVTAFAYDPRAGALKEIQTVSTLPTGWEGTSYTAEVVVHPSGRFLYGSNRGHDSIAVFRVDPRTGLLTAAGHQSTLGKTPRNFALAPGGEWLLAGNQASDSISLFRVDEKTGALTPSGEPVPCPAPVCLRFLPIAG